MKSLGCFVLGLSSNTLRWHNLALFFMTYQSVSLRGWFQSPWSILLLWVVSQNPGMFNFRDSFVKPTGVSFCGGFIKQPLCRCFFWGWFLETSWGISFLWWF